MCLVGPAIDRPNGQLPAPGLAWLMGANGPSAHARQCPQVRTCRGGRSSAPVRNKTGPTLIAELAWSPTWPSATTGMLVGTPRAPNEAEQPALLCLPTC